jgi:hypothetical protein
MQQPGGNVFMMNTQFMQQQQQGMQQPGFGQSPFATPGFGMMPQPQPGQPGMMPMMGMPFMMMTPQQPGMGANPFMMTGGQPFVQPQPALATTAEVVEGDEEGATTVNPMSMQQQQQSTNGGVDPNNNPLGFMNMFQPGAERNMKTKRPPVVGSWKNITCTQVITALSHLLFPIIGLCLAQSLLAIQLILLINNIGAIIIPLFIRSRIYVTFTALLSIALAITLMIEIGSVAALAYMGELIQKPVWWLLQMARTLG